MKKALSCLLILMFAMAAVAMTPPLSGWTVTIDSTSTGDTVYVTWGTNSVDIINPYHGNGITVTAENGNVTIISTTATTNIPYVLKGNSNAGSLTLTTAKKLKLFLDNLTLTSDTTLPAIYLTEKKDATVTLRGTSTLADNANNAQKGVLQSKGTLIFTGSGTLNVSGYAKHGIASTKESITVQNGTINVLTAASDGIHGVGVSITGGMVNVTNPNGDGIDGDEGAIEISGGEITVNCSANDVKGISCDSTLTISGGTVNVTVSGDQSKGFKTKENMFVTGGEITVNANGSVVLEEIGSGYDPSYCTGVKTSGDFTISNGTLTIVCPSSNAGGHGISTDGDCNVMGGTLHITATGSCVKYADTTGVYDVYASTCIKSDAGLNIGGGTVTVTAGGRALSCDGDYVQTGGNVTATTSANGFTTIGSGTSCTDGFAPACLKVDGNATVTGGLFNGTSTGTGGRGISCDCILTIGVPGGDDDDLFVRVTTSGSPVNGVSTNNSSIDIWKGLPKGIKIDGSIIINSGHVQSYCSQTSGDPNGEALESKDSLFINGGQIETNAYDDAINASNYIEINGGYVWAYARGNDAIDCNGTSMYINGGTVVAMGSECGLDDNSDGGGRLYIKGGNIVAVGSNGSGMGPGMGGTEGTPTMTNQKYITLGSSSGGGPGGGGGWPGGGGSSSSISATNGFTIKKDGTPILTFKAPTVSGNGFQNTMPSTTGGGTTGAKEGPGQQSSIGTILVSSPFIKCSGTYTYFTSPTISGGTNWHGLYSGATVSTSGSGTSTTPKPTSITSSGDTSAVACGSLTWYGTTYTASGTYTHVLHDICGADSTVTLHLTVYNGTHNVETATACGSYVWHDTEYFESGTYTYEYTNANGCESVDTLKLTIHYGTHNVITDTAYKFYEWHGETYNESGTYTFDYENNEGCESVDTLHLIVIHCNSITPPYTENFDSYTESTTAATGVEPDCWELVQEDVDMPDAKRPQLYYKSAFANSGNYSLLLNYRGIYAMPAMAEDVTIQDVKLEMYLRQANAAYLLEVGVWDDATNTFMPVALFNNATTGVEQVTCDFSSYTGNGRRIAFRNVLVSGKIWNYSYNYLDDITLTLSEVDDCAFSLSHTETFEDYTAVTTAATGIAPDCWELVQEDVDMPEDKMPQLYYKSSFAHSGDYSLRMYNRCVYAMPSLDAVDANISDLSLSMYLRQPNTAYTLEVGVWESGSNSEEAGVFVPVHVFNNKTTDVTFVECDFSSYTGNGGRIAFRNTLGGGKTWSYSYNYIDDITLDNGVVAKGAASDDNVIDAIGVERYLEGIVVYPNPTMGELHIGAMDVQKVECYNQMGQLVAVYNNVRDINISSLSQGVYTLRITVPQGVTMRKVVKR